MKKSVRNIVAAGALGVTVLGGGAVAFAQSADGSGPAAGIIERIREHRREHRGEWTEAMAGQLGVSAEELQSARQAAHETVVADLGEFERPESRPQTQEERNALRAELQTRKDAFDQALADQLGIPVEDLYGDRVAVVEPKLAQAVADGRISQERVDEILARIGAGELPGRR